MDIIQRITAEVDAVVKEIQDPKPVYRDVAGKVDLDARPKLQGMCKGLCMALSILNGSSVERERALAFERWEARESS